MFDSASEHEVANDLPLSTRNVCVCRSSRSFAPNVFEEASGYQLNPVPRRDGDASSTQTLLYNVESDRLEGEEQVEARGMENDEQEMEVSSTRTEDDMVDVYGSIWKSDDYEITQDHQWPSPLCGARLRV